MALAGTLALPPPPVEPGLAIVLVGTDRIMTTDQFAALEKALAGAPAAPALAPRAFVHSGEVVVSALASLYAGGRFIERFLANITSLDFFDRSELIIIDAASPDNERALIEEYQRRYPNIVYQRTPARIGIYSAWNIGTKLASGRYITNVNLDDLRGFESFRSQSEALDQDSAVDVVYQDFLYTLSPDLDFEQISRIGLASSLPDMRACTPAATTEMLFSFNPPHNAPMWRASLHDRLGGFDESFVSAGDLEFWLRCARAGVRFAKLKQEKPHVAYYFNPDGISSRIGSLGPSEVMALQSRERIPACRPG